jgi:hypothetical protein
MPLLSAFLFCAMVARRSRNLTTALRPPSGDEAYVDEAKPVTLSCTSGEGRPEVVGRRSRIIKSRALPMGSTPRECLPLVRAGPEDRDGPERRPDTVAGMFCVFGLLCIFCSVQLYYWSKWLGVVWTCLMPVE